MWLLLLSPAVTYHPLRSILIFWASSSVCQRLLRPLLITHFFCLKVTTKSVICSACSICRQSVASSHCGAFSFSFFFYCATYFAPCFTCSYSLTFSHIFFLHLFFSSVPVVRTWWRSPWMCLCAACSQIATSCGSRARTQRCWITLRPLSLAAPNWRAGGSNA